MNKQTVVEPTIANTRVEQWQTSRLIPYARNPRKNDGAVERMAASIREFGFKIPVLARSSGDVVDGHLRLKAALKLNLQTVPVMLCDEWTDAQVKAFRLMVNRSVGWAEWDDELLALELEELKNLDFDLTLTGFDDSELAELTAAKTEGLTDDDEIPTPPAEPVTRAGDMWLLGAHRLLNGDATKHDDIRKVMKEEQADCTWTDPPYNVAYEGKTKDKLTIDNDKMPDEQFRDFLRSAFHNAFAFTKLGGALYVAHSDSEGYNFRGACIDAGWLLKQTLIWVKNSMVMGRQDYQWRHEPILYGWKPGAAHSWCSDRSQTTVLEFDRPTRSTEHPTMKPVALVEYCTLNSTRAGDIILDPFGGSGTTLIVCEKNARAARLMELDPVYCDVIVQRWQNFTGKQATLENDGQTFGEVTECRKPLVA